MLELKNITKDYLTGDNTVHALKGVSLTFGDHEFVAVLGQSGCGKTTLLNIIGGLDGYTQGDLVINGRSTKEYKSSDWDTYRNHSIGFVFQSYNLIPHQTVLANVELALTLSGVSKAQRRARAVEALKRVGLESQIHKKPNQMSGGQMQRVAIARALVNDPDILLADEPTGALDTETSVQVMDILKEISKDKLVIMVTHNPDLAEKYATRTVHLLDGCVVSDNAAPSEEPAAEEGKKETAKKHTSMSFFTALSLSFNNLLTKKARTLLTSFAGSIGIIGIALILSMSNGVEAFISGVEEDTLSSYPLSIEEVSMDFGDMMQDMMDEKDDAENRPLDKVYSNNIMSRLANAMVKQVTVNDLKSFKTHLDGNQKLKEYVTDIQYRYSTPMNIYRKKDNGDYLKINPNDILESMGYSEQLAGMAQATGSSATNVWQELLENDQLLNKQYDVLAGHMPEAYNQVVLVVDKNNRIGDFALYSLGILDPDEVDTIMDNAFSGKEYKVKATTYSYDELLKQRFKLMINSDYYEKQDGLWVDRSEDDEFVEKALNNAIDIEVCGIIRPAEDALTTSVTGAVGYRSDLMKELIDRVNDSAIVKEQKEKNTVDIFTGIEFPDPDEKKVELKSREDLEAYVASLPQKEQMQAQGMMAQMAQNGMSEKEIIALFQTTIDSQTTDATYDGNLALLGAADLAKPSKINIYPKDFESKEQIVAIIDQYNENAAEDKVIRYTDYIGLLMSSVTTIINAISYILIAFVAVSLVVSSIMIGIITYISVLERTKEIGILRAIGASKRDISRVFNAETLIVGFAAGLIGIGLTLLLTIPINAIIYHLTDIANAAKLPVEGGIALVLISMLLTFIAGLIPSGIAARKDPVESLRSE